MNNNKGYTPLGNFNNVTINGFNSEWANSYHFTNSPITYKTIDLKNAEIESIDFNDSLVKADTNQGQEKHENKVTVGNVLATIGISFLLGLGQGIEPVMDCTIQATLEIAWLFSEESEVTYKILGVKTCANQVNEVQSAVKNWTSWFIGTNWTKKWTNDWIDSAGLRTNATDDIVKWTRRIEDSFGTAMLAKIPGPWAGISSAIISEGKSAESAYAAGSSFGQAALSSHVDGVVGFISGMLLKNISDKVKINSEVKDNLLLDGASNNFQSLLSTNLKSIGVGGVLKTFGFSTGTSIASNIAKSFTNYMSYGKNIKLEEGNEKEYKYNNFFDYFYKEDFGATIADAFFSGFIGPMTAMTGVDYKFGGFWQKIIKKIGLDAAKKGITDRIDAAING